MIDLIYFSWIRERIGKSGESIETKSSTVFELIEELRQRDPRYFEVFSDCEEWILVAGRGKDMERR